MSKLVRILVGVRTITPMQLFGVAGNQVNIRMSGIALEYRANCIVVRHVSFPNDEKWIMHANVAELSWHYEPEDAFPTAPKVTEATTETE